MQLLNIAILNAIVVMGLNFATGWTGQINFGQAAFYGLGAYATAIATTKYQPSYIASPEVGASTNATRRPAAATEPAALMPTFDTDDSDG